MFQTMDVFPTDGEWFLLSYRTEQVSPHSSHPFHLKTTNNSVRFGTTDAGPFLKISNPTNGQNSTKLFFFTITHHDQ